MIYKRSLITLLTTFASVENVMPDISQQHTEYKGHNLGGNSQGPSTPEVTSVPFTVRYKTLSATPNKPTAAIPIGFSLS